MSKKVFTSVAKQGSCASKVLIGLSWPYANGRLHIGHVASSLPADAIARFHRKIGNRVSFITGSDCYGTPIMVSAGKEGITPAALAEKYHQFHAKDFAALGFSFDLYDKTMSERHHAFVKKFHEELYRGEYVYEKTAPQLYCPKCQKYLPDRYVEGLCPHCHKPSKGDSCDHCGQPLEPEDLLQPKCILCGGTPEPRQTTQLYIKLSALQDQLRKFYDERKDKWTTNAIGMTKRYLDEGVHDRAITRSLDWGVPVPRDGWDDKRIYIWAENVLGYLSASEPEFIEDKGGDSGKFLHYYVHGKDNIPFHSVILPGLLFAHGNGKPHYHLPDLIVSSEYITVGGDKLSKSKGNQIFAYTLYENFDVDMVRYFFLRTVNDKRDSNFTIEEFVNIINGELVNNFGNLVNRTLSFIKTKFDNAIPHAEFKPAATTAKRVHELMYDGKCREALAEIMDLVNTGNKHFADGKPWVTLDKHLIGEVVDIIRTAADLLEPFIPTGAAKVLAWLSTKTLPEIGILYNRLDLATVEGIFKK